MPQEPITRKSAMAARVTNSLLRSTRSNRRPKSANIVAGRKTTSHNRRYQQSKYKTNESGKLEQRKIIRKTNNKAFTTSSLSNNFRHNRPSSAPYRGRRGAQDSQGAIATSPTLATSILQSNYVKLNPLEKREKGWSARPADMAGGIPAYDASKDKYCPLYSPERHVIPGLKPAFHVVGKKNTKLSKNRQRRKMRHAKDGGSNRTKLLDLRFEDEDTSDKYGKTKASNRIRVVNANEIEKEGTNKNIDEKKTHLDKGNIAQQAMREAQDALSPPRITFSAPTSESSKEVVVVKSILRREQTLQSLRDAVGRSKFNSKLVSALMERYREATVSTIEAVSRWAEGNEDAFMWHAKNYLLGIPSDLDALWHSKNIRIFCILIFDEIHLFCRV